VLHDRLECAAISEVRGRADPAGTRSSGAGSAAGGAQGGGYRLRSRHTFIEANIAHWAPSAGTDVLFANAVFQWVPDHIRQLKRLVSTLARGGVLAVQMPDNLDEPSHILMREVAQLEPWRKQLSKAVELRDALPKPGGYYDALRPLCARIEIWHTIYNHVLDDAASVVEWVKGTGLRPFVDPLEPPERKAYLTEYTARIAASFLPQADGKVLLRFPRIFIVAVK
jgi:trans-aconitate 2-methyltransferase